MEAISLSSALSTTVDPSIEQQPGADASAGEEPRPTAADLRRLMDLADRYARQLVAASDTPPGVLLLVHGGDLDVVALDGRDADVRALPQLLAKSQPSSAIVVSATDGVLGSVDGRVVFVVGETSDGLRDERRFRVRACGRTRRLTRLLGDVAEEAPVVPRLFPPPRPIATA